MSKLFCDCKTDEEKSNFFLSGQGVETGIIAPAISNEVAMAFHRCFEFEKQLAAAIAACKLKDEALLLAAETYNSVWESHMPIIDTEMDKALAIQPEYSALKQWLGEPIAYLDASYGFMRCGNLADTLPIGAKLYAPKGLPCKSFYAIRQREVFPLRLASLAGRIGANQMRVTLPTNTKRRNGQIGVGLWIRLRHNRRI